MRVRRLFGPAAALCAASLVAASGVEFLHITDTHVMKLDGVRAEIARAREHYAHTAKDLGAFLERVKRERAVSFILHTGDAIDGYCFEGVEGPPVCGQVDHFARILARGKLPVFLTLGNHDLPVYRYDAVKRALVADFSASKKARDEWAAASKSLKGGTHYSFRRRAEATEYVFLVLDNGERGAGADRSFAGTQLQWLKDTAEENRGRPLILVLHVPLGEDSYSEAIKAALPATADVVLSISGHKHTDAIEEVRYGERRFPQVRTAAFSAKPDNYRRFRLRGDRIEIHATGPMGLLEKQVLVNHR